MAHLSGEARAAPAAGLPVAIVMATDIEPLAPSMRLTEAIGAFGEHGHVALPVVEAGRLVGVLGERDLLRVLGREAGTGAFGVLSLLRDEGMHAAFARRCSGATVGAVMTRDVRTVGSFTPVAEAALVMAAHGVGCLPVVDDGRLVGLLTREDLLRAQAGAADRPVRPAERDRALERRARAEAGPLAPGEWLVVRVAGGEARVEGQLGDERRHADLVRRVAALPGIARVDDRLGRAPHGIW